MDTPETRWLTYREVAAVLGLPSPKAALNKSRREGWERRENNQRMAIVAVPVALLDAAAGRLPGSTSRDPPPTPSKAGNGTPPAGRGGEGAAMVLAELRVSHAAHLAELQQVVGRLERERDAARDEAVELRRELAAEREGRAQEREARARAEGQGGVLRAAVQALEAQVSNLEADRDREREGRAQEREARAKAEAELVARREGEARAIAQLENQTGGAFVRALRDLLKRRPR